MKKLSLSGLVVCCTAVLILAFFWPSMAMAEQSGDFSYEDHGSYIEITEYTGNSAAVTIPSTIAGKPVTSIADYTFNANMASITIPSSITSISGNAIIYCPNLTSIVVDSANPSYISQDGILFSYDKSILIRFPQAKPGPYTIPASVKAIGTWAFGYCSFEKFIIPSGVTSIGDSSFFNSQNLTSITIPNSVSSIGANAFAYCNGLKSLKISSSVTNIGESAFIGCSSLPSIVVDSANVNYSSGNGILYNKAKTTLITYPAGRSGAFTIPGSVTSVDNNAFAECSLLTYISIPSSVTSIGYSAFSDCTGLTSIKIPDSVLTIGDYAFSNCSNLKSVTLPASISELSYGEFSYCIGLTNITIPKSVKSIYGNAFKGCSGFTSITIPDSVTLIDYRAFRYCTGIKSITIPSSVTNIGSGAFDQCTALTSAIFKGAQPTMDDDIFTNVSAKFMVYYNIGFSSSWSGYTAHSKQAFCMLTLYFQNGSAAKTTMVNVNNGHIAAPAAPTRTGFTFAGWYQDAACKNSWNFTTNTVKSDLKLFAKWTTYKVTFNSQGGSAVASKYAPQNNATITAPTPPTRAGYNFEGWFKEADCKNAWIFATDKVTADITLFAKWSPVTPTVPTSVKAVSESYDSIKISWAAVPFASGYEVYRTASSSESYKLVGKATTASYIDKLLITGKPYYYKVKAFRTIGTKTYYSQLSNPTFAIAIPSTPVLTATSPSYTSIKLSWKAVAGATKYELYIVSNNTQTLLTTTTATTYTNINLICGKTYYYKVRACHIEDTKSIFSAYSTVVAAKPELGTPSRVNAARSSASSIDITWSVVTGATKYEVWRSLSPNGTYTLISTTENPNCTDTKVATDKIYYYKVIAYRLVGTDKIYSSFSLIVYA